jgi:hypothetical protein
MLTFSGCRVAEIICAGIAVITGGAIIAAEISGKNLYIDEVD